MPLRSFPTGTRRTPVHYFRGDVAEFAAFAKTPPFKQAFRRMGLQFSSETQMKEEMNKLSNAITAAKKAPQECVIKTNQGNIWLKVVIGKNQKLAILPLTALHGVGNAKTGSYYMDLLGILRSGLKAGTSGLGKANVVANRPKQRNRFSMFTLDFFEHKIKELQGDQYHLEFVAPIADEDRLIKGKRSQIVSVNIILKEGLTSKERQARMKRYRDDITKRYGIPVKFIDVSKSEIWATLHPKTD